MVAVLSFDTNLCKKYFANYISCSYRSLNTRGEDSRRGGCRGQRIPLASVSEAKIGTTLLWRFFNINNQSNLFPKLLLVFRLEDRELKSNLNLGSGADGCALRRFYDRWRSPRCNGEHELGSWRRIPRGIEDRLPWRLHRRSRLLMALWHRHSNGEFSFPRTRRTAIEIRTLWYSDLKGFAYTLHSAVYSGGGFRYAVSDRR